MKKSCKPSILLAPEYKKTLRIMKCTVLLICLSFTQVFANLRAQDVVVDLNVRNSSFIEVINILRSKTTCSFLFNAADVKSVDDVSINVKSKPLKKVLSKVLENTGLSFRFLDNTVVIIKQEKVLSDQKNKKTITGKVTDKDGKSLPGVSVVVKGSNSGVATDIDGNFEIMVEDKSDIVLVFSFVGMKNQEINIGNKKNITVVLKADTEQLEEVVCTGYQTLSKERQTGSFGLVKSEDLKIRATTSVVEKLEGKVAGVNINNGVISIRGIGTINSIKTPLIVVDGFPISGTIEDINSNDIKNITVLKDAAAASIYGTRSANGVIVITTYSKSAKKGIQIDASYNRIIKEKPDYKDLQLMDSKDVLDIQQDIIKNDIYMNEARLTNPNSARYSLSLLQEYYLRNKYSSVLSENLRLDDSQYTEKINKLRNINGFDQFSDYLLRNSITDQINVSIKNKTDKGNTFVSLGLESNKLSSKGDDNTKVLLNIKNNFKLNDKLNTYVSTNIIYHKFNQNGINALNYFQNKSPLEPIIYDGLRFQNAQIRFNEIETKNAQGYLPYTYNAIDQMESNNNIKRDFNSRTQLGLNYKIFNCLSFDSKFQYEYNTSKVEKIYTLQNPEWRYNVNNFTIYNEADDKLQYNLPLGGRLNYSNIQNKSYILRNQLNFNKTWGKHDVKSILGHEIRKRQVFTDSHMILGFDSQVNSSKQYDLDGFLNRTVNGWFPNAIFRPELPQKISTDLRDVSTYFNVAYSYDEKYALSGSFRMDKSNIFGCADNAKNNILWSIGGNWNISRESFMDKEWIDRLVLRTTYGVNGNRPKYGSTAYLTGEFKTTAELGPNVNVIKLLNPENKDLHSEKVYSLNIGIDFSFLRRIQGSIDLYQKRSTDLLGNRTLDPSVGWASSTVNYAKMLNKGIDIALGLDIVKTTDFNYNLGLIFSYNKNKIKEIDLTPSSSYHYYNIIDASYSQGLPIKGKEYYRLYAYRWGGLDKDGMPQVIDEKGEVLAYNKATLSCFKYVGTSVAPYYGNINNKFRYKNWHLSIDISYKFGHKMRAPLERGVRDLQFSNVHKSYKYKWTKKGDENLTNVPVFIYNDNYMKMWVAHYRYRYADINILNASYAKLRHINLSYTIPKNLVKKFKLENVVLKAQASNLYTWTANSWNIDPEANDGNMLSFPEAKSLSLGISITL